MAGPLIAVVGSFNASREAELGLTGAVEAGGGAI